MKSIKFGLNGPTVDKFKSDIKEFFVTTPADPQMFTKYCNGLNEQWKRAAYVILEQLSRELDPEDPVDTEVASKIKLVARKE